MNFARGSKVGYSGPNLNDSNESSSLNGYHNNASSSSSSSSSGSRHVSFEDSNDQWDHYRMERGLGKKNLQWMPYLTMFGTMISFFAVGVLVTNRLSSSGFGDSSYYSGNYFTSIDSSYANPSTSTLTTASSTSSPQITYYNEYTQYNPLKGEYPWTDIVEPHRVTYFKVSNADSSDQYYYEWYVNGYHHTTGTLANITFVDDPGTFETITLKKVATADDEVVGTTELTAIDRSGPRSFLPSHLHYAARSHPRRTETVWRKLL
jgi:hypothetical protein